MRRPQTREGAQEVAHIQLGHGSYRLCSTVGFMVSGGRNKNDLTIRNKNYCTCDELQWPFNDYCHSMIIAHHDMEVNKNNMLLSQYVFANPETSALSGS
jgi:hypothetical protein